MLWIFLLEIPTGAVADFLGRKYSLAMAGLVTAIATLVYGSVPLFGVFLIAEFLYAMGAALSSGADDALLYDALKEEGRESESKKIFGRANTIHLAGIFLAAPIGSLMAQKFGVNSPMLFSAIPTFLCFLVALSIREPKVHDKTPERKRYLLIAKNGISFFVHHRVLRLLALDGVLVAAGAYFVIWFYQPILMKLGLPIFWFGFIQAALVGAEMLISANFTRLEKWAGGAKGFLKFGALVTGLSFFIVAIWPSFWTVGILLLFAGGFGLTRLDLMSAYMNKLIPSEQRATVLSSISMLRRIALVILNPIMGFIFDKSLMWAMILAGTIPLLVFFFSPIENEGLE